VDTIKLVDRDSLIVGATLDRGTLWAAQTPQFALTAELRAAHERGRLDGVAVTDDAALLERIGISVVVVASTSENFKVTLPGDVDSGGNDFERAAHASHPAPHLSS
jgi:2-C-methyl-D-erythritol 4-phosphate cytidylyltransferase